MTGTRLLLTLSLELRRRGLTRGLAAACIGGGQGIAAIVEAADVSDGRTGATSHVPRDHDRSSRPLARSMDCMGLPGLRRRARTPERWIYRSLASLPPFALNSRSSGCPVRIERRVEDPLQLGARLVVAVECRTAFRRGRSATRCSAGVGERLAQVLLGLLVAAAEQARHLVVPAAERAVGGSLLERRGRASARSAARP